MCISNTTAAQEKGYQNPIIPGFYPDPSICAVDDDYYLVNSSFAYFPGVPIFHSRDLVNWEQIGNVLDRKSQLNLAVGGTKGGIYAPTIRYNDGMYYMITTNTTNKGKNPNDDKNVKKSHFVVHATNPAGPWSDPVWLEGGGIDPSLYFEKDKCYMLCNLGGASLCEINPMTGEQLTPLKHICSGAGGRYPEGPHIYKKDGWYYLLMSEGGTEEAHCLTIFRSKNIYGPYEPNPSNPILTHCKHRVEGSPIHGTGHGDFVQATDGSWWIVVLGYRPHGGGTYHVLGRETFLAPVRWDNNAWPVINGNGTLSLNMNVPTLPLHPFEIKPMRTEFKDKKLGFDWLYLCNPDSSCYKLESNVLKLSTTDKQLDDDNCSPTFIGKRQAHLNCEVTVPVKLHASQHGDMAGITVYMSNNSHYDIAIRQDRGGSQSVVLSYRLFDLRQEVATAKISKGSTVYLRARANANHYQFSYSTDGENFNDMGKLNTRYLSSEVAGGFTGVIMAIFAQGKPGTKGSAVIPWFEYKK